MYVVGEREGERESRESFPGCFPAVSGLWLLGPSGLHPNISALEPDVWTSVMDFWYM